jgi:hypothetical protein
MTLYQVTVTMAPATVTALVDSGCSLYVLRAVESADLAGRPLLWMSAGYSVNTYVTWQDNYDGVTSPDMISAGQRVAAGFSAALDIGQLLGVQAGGIGYVSSAGQPGALSILNTTSTYFTCGIGAGTGTAAAPFCAFPLYGNNIQVVVPLQKILLVFASQVIPPGTVIDNTYVKALTSSGPGVLIDLTSASQRALSYDVNGGWTWGGYAWAQMVPADSNLVPLLIERPAAREASNADRDAAHGTGHGIRTGR